MKLRHSTIIEGVEYVLSEKIRPLLEDGFADNDLRMAISLLAISRLAREDEVAVIVQEHDWIRALFADAAPIVRDPALAARLADAASGRDESLRLPDLDAGTAGLRALLVELHAHLESLESDEARRLDQAIWRMLRDVEAARAPRA